MNRETVYAALAGVGTLGLGIGIYTLGKRWMCQNSEEYYESNKALDEYMAFHYAPPDEYIKYPFCPRDALDFPVRCAQLCAQHKLEGVLSRALDVGCSVGRTTFELSKTYDEVLGIDFSRAFVSKCQQLKVTGQTSYFLVSEGLLGEEKTASIDPAIDRSKVHFSVGDACSLPQLGKFGCVFAGNLICRLPDPMKFLSQLSDMVVPGGIVVFTSPYTWLTQYTPKDHWLGGFKKDGKDVRGLDSLREILSPHFEFLMNEDMPFLIRETVRKHQWGVAHATVWKRK